MIFLSIKPESRIRSIQKPLAPHIVETEFKIKLSAVGTVMLAMNEKGKEGQKSTGKERQVNATQKMCRKLSDQAVRGEFQQMKPPFVSVFVSHDTTASLTGGYRQRKEPLPGIGPANVGR